MIKGIIFKWTQLLFETRYILPSVQYRRKELKILSTQSIAQWLKY